MNVSTASQVWMPWIDRGPANREIMEEVWKAKMLWQGQTRIWLLPGLKEAVTWRQKVGDMTLTESAFPSKVLNGVAIYHLDGAGGIFPLGRIIGPQRLYQQWLDSKPTFQLGKSKRVNVPKVLDGCLNVRSDGAMEMEDVLLESEIGALMPVEQLDEATGHIQVGWQNCGVSLDHIAESSKLVPGGLIPITTMVGGQTVKILLDQSSGTRWVYVDITWPLPFNQMFPICLTSDTLFHHRSEMRRCLELSSKGKLQAARRFAQSWADRLSGKIETTFEQAWLAPKLSLSDDEIIGEARAQLGIRLNDYGSLISSRQFGDLRLKPQQINWHLGWLGYFWYELSRDLNNHLSVRICQRCGKVLTGGRADKRFCSRSDNPKCRKSYDAERQRKVFNESKKQSTR